MAIIKEPQSLACQPDSEEGLVFFTHFDCWNTTSNPDESNNDNWWAWDDGAAVNQVWLLMRDAWALTDDEEYMMFAPQYLAMGQVPWFAELEKMFIASGYHVYNSDTFFEVYDPKVADVDDEAQETHEVDCDCHNCRVMEKADK